MLLWHTSEHITSNISRTVQITFILIGQTRLVFSMGPLSRDTSGAECSRLVIPSISRLSRVASGTGLASGSQSDILFTSPLSRVASSSLREYSNSSQHVIPSIGRPSRILWTTASPSDSVVSNTTACCPEPIHRMILELVNNHLGQQGPLQHAGQLGQQGNSQMGTASQQQETDQPGQPVSEPLDPGSSHSVQAASHMGQRATCNNRANGAGRVHHTSQGRSPSRQHWTNISSNFRHVNRQLPMLFSMGTLPSGSVPRRGLVDPHDCLLPRTLLSPAKNPTVVHRQEVQAQLKTSPEEGFW